MSNMGLDEDVEAIDYLGDEESDEETFDGDTESFDEEGYEDAEASAATLRRRRDHRRRALARRELARRRGALARARSGRSPAGRGSPPTTKAAVATTQAAVRTLDLEGKVQADEFNRRLDAHAKRTGRAEIATVASVVVNQFQGTFQNRPGFGFLNDPIGKAAISFAPLLLLSPAKRGSGPGAFALDARVMGGAAIAAILAAHKLTEPKAAVVPGPSKVVISAIPKVTQGTTITFLADVLDETGKIVPSAVVIWSSSNASVATVDPTTGAVTAVTSGITFITATNDGIVERVALEVGT